MTARHKKIERKIAMQETRQSLLNAAAGEFAVQGYDKANVNRIAESAGFAIGTVYNYFPNKRELMYAFIDETARFHVDYILDRVRSEKDPSKRIEVFFQAGFAFVESNLTQAKAIFNVLNGPDQEFKLRMFQGYQGLFRLLSEEILIPGIDQGVFRQVDPQLTSNLLMLVYLGTGSQFGPQGKLWLEDSFVADFVLRSLQTGD